MQSSKFLKLYQIKNLSYSFFKDFEELKLNYTQKSRSLRYYRSWCEWNYIRINSICENILLKLDKFYPSDCERILDLIDIFEKSIDIISGEIKD